MLVSEKMRPLLENNSAIRACLKRESAWPLCTERKMCMTLVWEIQCSGSGGSEESHI